MGIVFFLVLLFYPINNKEFPCGAQMERTICVNKMCHYHTILNKKQRSSEKECDYVNCIKSNL